MQDKIFLKESVFNCSAEELYDWHTRPGALERLLPPWENTEIIKSSGGLAPGTEVDLKLKLGPFPISFQARHMQAVPSKMFRDRQVKGPFAKWSHSHFFQQRDHATALLDKVIYRIPFQNLLPQFISRYVDKNLQRMFIYRTEQLINDIQLHKTLASPPLRILISGASGSLGRDLVPLLTTGGHKVWTLVRRPPIQEKNEIFWDPDAGILHSKDIPDIDGVIHLAGEYIGLNRWTDKSKNAVIKSRIKGTNLISSVIANMEKIPKVFLCASAVGYYGDCGTAMVDETSAPGSDFISEVCSTWENATKAAQEANIRTVFLRLGVGLTPKSGALRRILTTSPFGMHRYFGSGEQYISWISNEDIISAMLHTLVTPSLSGPLNIAAPCPVTNFELMNTLAKVTGRPLLFPIPAWPLKLIYGQMASEILLSGCRVSSEKLTRSGFTFRHPDLETALRFMLGRMPDDK